jgi:hypothetical protein
MRKTVNGLQLLASIDEKTNKKHETPYDGQRWMRIVDNGRRVIWGRVFGLTEYQTVEGVTHRWMAHVWDGTSSPIRISSDEHWRAASEWHAAPPEFQDFQDAAFSDFVGEVRKMDKTYLRKIEIQDQRIRELEEKVAGYAELAAHVSRISGTLDGLLVKVSQMPGLPTPPDDPVKDMVKKGK